MRILTSRFLKRTSGAVIAALMACLTPGISADTVATQNVRFSTKGQSLWGPGVGEVTEEFHAVILDEERHESEGEWHEDVSVEVDNDTAVDAWDRAVDACDRRTYRKGPFSFSPTRSQCIDGVTKCWPDPTWKDPLRKTCITVPGIGPRPSGTIDRKFDIGARINFDSNLRFGLTGGVTFDAGTVDADYDALVRLEADVDDVEEGDVFTLRTRIVSDDAGVSTQWPNVSGRLVGWIDGEAKLTAEAAGPNTQSGEQMRESKTLFERTTDGVKSLELVAFEQNLANFNMSVLGEPFIEFNAGIELGLGVDVFIEGVGDVGLPIGDLGVFSPTLATPVVGDLAAAWDNGSFDGRKITNILEPGRREFFSYGFISDGVRDTDLMRVDNDIDFFWTAVTGIPLGVSGGVGTIIPGALSLLEVEGNLFDIDVAQFIGFREEVAFEPRLMVELRFSQGVQVETWPGSGQFEFVDAGEPVRVEVGADLRIVHPGGNLRIDPVYTLGENQFVNDTDLVVSRAIQGTMAQLKLGGLVFTAAGGLGMPTNLAMAQITAEIDDEPQKLADVNFYDDGSAARFALGGFRDIAGSSLTISAGQQNGAAMFQRGDSNADGSVDLSDGIHTLRALFVAAEGLPCLAAANTNGDASVDIADVVYLFDFLFLGGQEPAAPFGACGPGTLPSDAVHGCSRSACR